MATVRLDPEIERLKHIAVIPDFNSEVLAKARETPLFELPELSDAVERTDHVIDDSTGVVVRVHRNRGSEGVAPCVYSIHGGGYVGGARDRDDAKFDRWCQSLGIVGVSVEYRLAPETPYPGALEDCYAGLKWTFEQWRRDRSRP